MRINFSELGHSDLELPTTHQINQNLLDLLSNRTSPLPPSRNPEPFNIAFSEPFAINRTLSPQNLQRELSYLKDRHQLPSSAIKFIENELYKSAQLHQTTTDVNLSIDFPQTNQHESYFNSASKEKKKKKSPRTQNKQHPTRIKNLNKKNAIEIGERSHRRAEEKAERMKRVVEERLAMKKQRQIQQLTLQPILSQTINSKPAKKIGKKRQQHFKSQKIDIFQLLYADAQRQTSKRQLEAIKLQQEKVFKKPRYKEKIRIYSTFEERLRQSLQKSAQKKSHCHNKPLFDPSTGRKMFEPNTTLSKLTYYSHFKSTESISSFCQGKGQARPEKYTQQSAKLNKSHEDITTTFNQVSQMNRRLQGKPESVGTIVGKRQERTADFYADMIWIDGALHKENLDIAEQKVLAPFIEGLSSFDYSASVSRNVFKTLFKDFLGSLNLYDKQILFERMKNSCDSWPSSRSDLNSSLQLPSRRSSVVAPDHWNKYYYI